MLSPLFAALLVHLPRLPSLSLSLSLTLSYLSFRCLFFAPRFTLHLTFGLALSKRKNLSFFFCFSSSIFAFCLCFLLVLFLFHCFRAYSVCSVGTHSPQHDLCHGNSPRHSKGSTCPPRSLRSRLIRDLSILRVSPFASQRFVRCFTCLVSTSLCSCLFRFFLFYFAIH